MHAAINHNSLSSLKVRVKWDFYSTHKSN